MSKEWTETELIKGLINSEGGSFEYFYKNYYPMIRNFIVINSGREEDAKDIFQECLIDLYEKLKAGKMNLTCSIKTFLYSMCRNQWLTRLKRNSKTVAFTETHAEVVEIQDEMESAELLNERQKVLSDLIKRLGDSCQKLLVMFYYQQLSMNLIAEKLGYTNSDNAKNQKYKCLQKLKELARGDSRIKDIL